METVSQFTLLASTKKGSKPDFHGAMGGDEARRLYEHFFSKIQQGYKPEKVQNGVFQAMMEVALVNDGPVRLLSLLLPLLFCVVFICFLFFRRSFVWCCEQGSCLSVVLKILLTLTCNRSRSRSRQARPRQYSILATRRTRDQRRRR